MSCTNDVVFSYNNQEYSKNDWNTARKVCDKYNNYTFSMLISRNENYSHWVHKCFEHACWHAEITWMRGTLFKLIVNVIAKMTRNDPPTEHEWSIRPRSAVDSAQ